MNEQLIGDLFAEATRRMTGSSSKEFGQKFAELIVQECIEKIEFNYIAMVGTYPGAHNATVRKCVVTVKQHFGVEE